MDDYKLLQESELMQDANHVRRLNKRRPLENEGLVNRMRAE